MAPIPPLRRPARASGAGLALALAAAAPAAAQPLGASFFDDFTRFEHSRWFASDGWSNGDHQNCLWSESAVDHRPGRLGLLFLHAPTDTHAYRCAEIQSHAHYHYGTFEARIRTDDGSGMNAAFFTYIGPTHGQRHDEIDFEILTAQLREVTLNTHVDGHEMHGATAALPAPANAAFHVYSFVWEPGRVRWFVDGVLVHAVQDAALPERAQKIYLSLWGSDTLVEWMGPFEPPDRPRRMEVDWVAYTALGEGCRFAASVLCTLQQQE